MQAASFILKIYRIEYFKIVFISIYNCAYETLFASPIMYMIIVNTLLCTHALIHTLLQMVGSLLTLR